jgi:hypothetical protein
MWHLRYMPPPGCEEALYLTRLGETGGGKQFVGPRQLKDDV